MKKILSTSSFVYKGNADGVSVLRGGTELKYEDVEVSNE